MSSSSGGWNRGRRKGMLFFSHTFLKMVQDRDHEYGWLVLGSPGKYETALSAEREGHLPGQVRVTRVEDLHKGSVVKVHSDGGESHVMACLADYLPQILNALGCHERAVEFM